MAQEIIGFNGDNQRRLSIHVVPTENTEILVENETETSATQMVRII
jgi:hypothetical protein